ncbi:hypothetical protein L2E82_12172 [Cichorium intybus]|uniref:Uncharacterized protein n=1 Tax=Cichorium intybus TaxID=13427 RepID=A0ACB9GET9_CICIN|nr:hypothetical protein L2E82_12172 [Cichorium intybus]
MDLEMFKSRDISLLLVKALEDANIGKDKCSAGYDVMVVLQERENGLYGIESGDRLSLVETGNWKPVLVLAPTKELSKQVESEIKEFTPYLITVCLYGGVSYNSQQNASSDGVDVVVGTPGRLIDLIDSNTLKLGEV